MRVVIGVDRSLASRYSFERVIALNWPAGTEFLLVSVIRERDLSIFEEGKREETKRFAAQFCAGLARHLTDRQIAKLEFRIGDPAENLIDVARERKADLIVVGANGKSAIEKTVLGSVSQAVLEYAPCPVLIVRDCGYDNRQEYRNVLVGLDSSHCSDLALRWFSRYEWKGDTHLNFVTVVPGLPRKYTSPRLSVEDAVALLEEHGDLVNQTRESIGSHLASCFAGLNRCDWSLDVVEGEIGQALVSLARERSADLIVVGSHGYAGLAKLFVSSVSSFIASHAPCSTLVVKPRAGASTHISAMEDYLREQNNRSSGNEAVPHVTVMIR